MTPRRTPGIEFPVRGQFEVVLLFKQLAGAKTDVAKRQASTF